MSLSYRGCVSKPACWQPTTRRLSPVIKSFCLLEVIRRLDPQVLTAWQLVQTPVRDGEIGHAVPAVSQPDFAQAADGRYQKHGESARFLAESGGERINDHHLVRAVQNAARSAP